MLKFYFSYVLVFCFCQRALLFLSIPICACTRSVLKVICALLYLLG